jgi:putative chitinase
MTAGWFWDTHKINAPADAGDHVRVTKIINGGTIGLAQRIAETNLALSVLTA